MIGNRIACVGAASAVLTVLAPFTGPLASQAVAQGATTLQFFTHDTEQTNLDLGPSGAGPGDQLVFSGDVFDRPGGLRLGRLAGQVTTLSGNLTAGEILFSCTFVLGGGQIAIQTAADSAALLGRGETLPVVVLGGTGAYTGAGGGGTIQIPNQTDANVVLNIVTR